MKKLLTITLIGLLLAVVTPRVQAEISISENNKLRIAEAAIMQLYVDSVDETKLVEDAIRGMLESLDPHSQYSNAEETKELNEPLAGNFSGVGISFNMNNDTLYVIQTVGGGPSERVGILAGDRIIAVNDTVIAGVKMKNTDIMKRLRGPKGTDVDIKVLRQNDTINFRVTRADIPIYSVDASYMVDDKTGYIRLNRFAAETADEIREALKALKKQGMDRLIFDLSDNGGGYLNAAVDLLGEFLEPGQMTVYTEGLNSSRMDNYASPGGSKPLFDKGRLVIMANQYSASASEITSGAVQDWDRGLIVGRRTFGKGLVQRPIPLPDGSMIRLTVAHYYTPAGRDIQKPYEKGKRDAYSEDILERYYSGELMHEDSIHHVDSLRMETLVLKRPIYGGGGIYPDKFVPLDTTEYTRYYRSVMAKGLINSYAIKYVDNNREEVKRLYKNDEVFTKEFQVTPAMLQELYDMATKDGIDFEEEQANKSAPLFSMLIKALIGRDIYDNSTYYRVYNTHDPIFEEAYKLINGEEYDRLLKSPDKKD
ncbi:MAG: S41 family peptidase [Muribaculaceae bacterium]|nr:S41 family peptidase [Muribaculaceae bacterium]